MKIKVNDEVIVLAGKDKGKTGKVLKTLKKENKVVVEGINMIKKHQKPGRFGGESGIFDMEAPIHASNVKKVEEKKKAEKKTETKKADTKKTTAKKTTAKKSTKKAKEE